MTPTAEELLDSLLQRFCTECGEDLPGAGQPCPACGALPQVTREEAAERLARPGAVAMVAATRLRAEVRRRQEQNSQDLRRADLLEHTARLEAACDEAAGKLPPLRAEAARHAGELETAQAREREAMAAEADSRANYTKAAKAEERARRTKKDAATRTEALMRLNAAAPVLEADQAALRAATAERERVEAALAAACQRVEQAQAQLRAAGEAVAGPGRAPKSMLTLAMDLTRQALSGDLLPVEQSLVRGLGLALANVTGARETIAAKAVEQAGAEKEERVRNMPAFLRQLPDGSYATEPNPFSPATPRQGAQAPAYHSPAQATPGITVRPGIG